MIKEFSFFTLINQYILEIPIIQRDYAQGRKLPNVTYIREKFVKELISALMGDKPMHLGFIYGKIEGREAVKNAVLHQQAVETLLGTVKQYANQFNIDVQTSISAQTFIESNTLRFIPLDGQQRLTTLFLLFWYINMRQGHPTPAPWIKNFKYNNRKAALAFFQALSNPNFIKTITGGLETDLEKQIRSYTWYLSKWDYDATTSGALTMLQAIHQEFAVYPDFDFGQLELSKLPFRFDFFDLDELRQSDNLYIKMNERGKQLTDFEHFKAWLQDYSSQHFTSQAQKNFLDAFWVKLDTVWLDYFWQNIDADYGNLDDFFFNFIKTMAISYQFATWPEKDLPAFLKTLLQQIRNEAYDPKKVKYIPISRFLHQQKLGEETLTFELFSYDALLFIDHSFETMMRIHSDGKLSQAIDSVIGRPFAAGSITAFLIKKDFFVLNLWDHVIMYAILEYLKHSENLSMDHLIDWLRIVRNLTYNTYVQSPENLYNALQSVRKLTKEQFREAQPLAMQIQQADFELRFFNQTQLKEEQLKAGFISDPAWQAQILALEKHPYFYGQIDFVFKLALPQTGQTQLEAFSAYADTLSSLFLTDTPDFRLQRALLAQGDYLVQTGSNYTFCKTETDSLRSRNENWRRVFNDDKKRSLLKDLIEKLHLEQNISIMDSLDAVISQQLYNTGNWEYYFITEPFTIQNCRNLEIRWFGPANVRLLQGSAITGYHLELRTVALFRTIEREMPIRAPFKSLDFLWDKSTTGRPGIAFSGFTFQEMNYSLAIRYDFEKDGCYYLDLWETSKPQKPISAALELAMDELGFAFNPALGTLWLAVSHFKIVDMLKQIATRLSAIKEPGTPSNQESLAQAINTI